MGRPRAGVPALCAAAIVVAGCGGNSDDGSDAAATTAKPATPAQTTAAPAPAPEPAAAPSAKQAASADDPIARAARVAADLKGGVAVTMSGKIDSKGTQSTISGKGTVDHDTRRGGFTITTGIAGAKIDVREVMDGKSIYLNTEILAGRLPGKKSWMKIDLAKAARTTDFDLASLGTNGPSQDPSQVLDYLHGAGPSEKVGEETINGVKTTHYRATVDLKRAIRRSDATGKSAVKQLLGTLAKNTKTIPIEVWIDDAHRVRRERVRYTATINGIENTMDFTTSFTAFGVPVKVKTPPASDTVDGLKLLQKAQIEQAQPQPGSQSG